MCILKLLVPSIKQKIFPLILLWILLNHHFRLSMSIFILKIVTDNTEEQVSRVLFPFYVLSYLFILHTMVLQVIVVFVTCQKVCLLIFIFSRKLSGRKNPDLFNLIYMHCTQFPVLQTTFVKININILEIEIDGWLEFLNRY